MIDYGTTLLGELSSICGSNVPIQEACLDPPGLVLAVCRNKFSAFKSNGGGEAGRPCELDAEDAQNKGDCEGNNVSFDFNQGSQ